MEKLYIDKQEVFRYMGHVDGLADDQTVAAVEECIEEVRYVAEARSVFREFCLVKGRVLISSHVDVELEGKDIKRHLETCDRIIALAVTLGHGVDRLIRYSGYTSMSKALAMDACASAAVEALADRVSSDLACRFGAEGVFLTSRYSPGYGDFPIQTQSILLSMLDAEAKIGITATSNHILIPRKSITALIGLSDKKCQRGQLGCEHCRLAQSCLFRKGGMGFDTSR